MDMSSHNWIGDIFENPDNRDTVQNVAKQCSSLIDNLTEVWSTCQCKVLAWAGSAFLDVAAACGELVIHRHNIRLPLARPGPAYGHTADCEGFVLKKEEVMSQEKLGMRCKTWNVTMLLERL